MNILSITGALFSMASLVLMFVQWRWTAVVAFVGLLLTVLGSSGFAGAMLPLFWGFAALVVIGLNYMLPREVVASRLGVGYIGLGGLTGLVLGYLISVNVMVIGAVVGIALGGLAFSMTHSGRHLDFPSARFLQYLCAKGLPSAVVLSMAGYVAIILIEEYAR